MGLVEYVQGNNDGYVGGTAIESMGRIVLDENTTSSGGVGGGDRLGRDTASFPTTDTSTSPIPFPRGITWYTTNFFYSSYRTHYLKS